MLLQRCIITTLLSILSPLLIIAQQKDTAHYNNPPFSLKSLYQKIDLRIDTPVIVLGNPFKKSISKKKFLQINGGYAAYNFNYRSNVDTPYVERNIAHHSLTGQLNIGIAGILPLQVNYWLRRTNSSFFRNITDVQVSFNSYAFRNQLQTAIKERLIAITPSSIDSLTDKLYQLKNAQLSDLSGFMQGNFSGQTIAEAHDILRIPRLTWDPYLKDSVNSRREDSIKKVAALLLGLYGKTKAKYDSLHHEVDSLKKIYNENLHKLERARQLIRGGFGDMISLKNLQRQLEEYGMSNTVIPKKYRWLMGLRKFSLGRSNANYSELTAKNISVNGLNLEYNSWYYFAVAAGTVNYRFRDFAVGAFNRKPQTFVMVRAGIGSLQKNYFIVSAYRGKKQLFATQGANQSLVTISGVSAESRLYGDRRASCRERV